MRRLFIAGEDIQGGSGGRITIKDRGNIHYLSVVLRMNQGDELFVSDGVGQAYRTRIKKIVKDGIELDIVSEHQSNNLYNTRITLYQGLPKGVKMDDIVRKTTELGVYRIIPTLTARSIPSLKGAALAAKTERWRRIAREAAQQSRRINIPEVSGIVGFEDALKGLKAEGYGLILALDELEPGTTIKNALREVKENGEGEGNGERYPSLAVFIGPEGGFEREEIVSLIKEGARPVSLGETILRTETAGFAALAMIFYEVEL